MGSVYGQLPVGSEDLGDGGNGRGLLEGGSRFVVAVIVFMV